jgi:hypothetical protein
VSSRLHARNLWVAFAVVFAIAVPAVQAALHLGLDAATFSHQGDQTLRAAPAAFAIWSLIYAGLVAMAVYQLTPSGRGAPALRPLSRPAVLAILGCGVWIIASALNWQWASVAIIGGSAAVLLGMHADLMLPLAGAAVTLRAFLCPTIAPGGRGSWA